MKIVAVGCIHNDVENLLRFVDILRAAEFDVLVCPGDFTDGALPKGFSNIDIGKLIVEEFKSLGKPVLVVPGSWDRDLLDFFDKSGLSIHGKGKEIKGVGFYGYGGAKTPFGLPLEPSEDEIFNGLKKAYDEVKRSKIKVQVTHAPPARTKLDMIPSGAHVGSEAVRKFLEQMNPQAAICAHIHEARGVDEIKNIKIVNTGRLPEGHYALIEVTESGVSAKIVDLI